MSDEYAGIAAHPGQYPVRLMCQALGVSVGGLYDVAAQRAVAPSTRFVEDERRRVQVRAAHTESHQP